MTVHVTAHEIETITRDIIASFLRVGEEEIELSTNIVTDLGADSLALVELGFLLSEKFSVTISNDDDSLLDFGRLVEHIVEQSQVI